MSDPGGLFERRGRDGIDNNGDAEGCDDGNTDDGDGCTAACVLELCGDGVDNNGDAEECDDGNTDDGDLTVVTADGELDPSFDGTNSSATYAGIGGGPGTLVEGGQGFEFVIWEELIGVEDDLLVAGTVGNTDTRAFVQRFGLDGTLDVDFAACGGGPGAGTCTLQTGTTVPRTACLGAPSVHAGFRDIAEDGFGDDVGVGYWLDQVPNPDNVMTLVARLTADGCYTDVWTFDAVPGDEFITDVEVDGAGNIYVIGYVVNPPAANDALVMKLTPTGSLDPSFGDGGVVVLDNLAVGNQPPSTQPDSWNGAQLDGERLLLTGTSRGPGANDFVVCALRVGEGSCGDGLLMPELFEECDDGNDVDGDGCTACVVDP